MAGSNIKKSQRQATKQFLVDLFAAGCEATINLVEPLDTIFKLTYYWDRGAFNRRKFRRTVLYAKKHGYIGIKERGDELTITLSELGQNKALRYSVDDMHIETPAVWDRKWRVVMFDIPEEMRLARNVFKDKLDEMGFAALQKSFYIHPFPCHNEIEFLRSLYSINQFVKMLVVERLEGEDELKKRFELK